MNPLEVIFWIFIAILIVISFVGLVYPIIPSTIVLLFAYLVYGFLFSFEPLNWLFWTIQILFFALIFFADYLANLLGVKKYGGTKAGIWGSTIGMIVGPFVIPVLGIIIGPFIGAVLAEILFQKKKFNEAVKIGIGSVVGFIGSVVVKAIIMIIMVSYFLIAVL